MKLIYTALWLTQCFPFAAPFPMSRAPSFCSDGSDHAHQRRCARAGQPAVQEDEEDPVSGNPQWPHTGRRRGRRGTSKGLSTFVFLFFDPSIYFSPFSALLLYCSKLQKIGKDWHVFFCVCVCRKQSSTSCRQARWTVWRALSLCPPCPSAPAPRVPQSTAWPMARTTVLRWPWCRRENRLSPLTAPLYTAPLYVIKAGEHTICKNLSFSQLICFCSSDAW